MEGRDGIVETRRLLLKPISEVNLKTLHQWRNEPDFRKMCSNRREEISFEEFKKELKCDFERDRHLQMVIWLKRTGAPIGTIYSYGFKATDGYVFVTTFLDSVHQGRGGYGVEAFAAFVQYLFAYLPLFKIYLEVYEYNRASFSLMRRAGLSEEGRFRQHRLFDGQRYDTLRFALYREDLERFRRVLDAFQIQDAERR